MSQGFEVAITGFESGKMSLIALVRRDKGYSDHPCHLFVYTGDKEPFAAFQDAAEECAALPVYAESIKEGDGYFTWFDLMGDGDGYAEVFAKHGLIEVSIPMGMGSVVVGNNDNI